MIASRSLAAIAVIMLLPAVTMAQETQRLPGGRLLGEYLSLPDPLTRADEVAIGSDLKALCQAALDAVPPLSPTETQWLDRMAPDKDGRGRGIAYDNADPGKINRIQGSSAYVRDSLTTALRTCLYVAENRLSPTTVDDFPFAAKWSSVGYAVWYLGETAADFDTADQNGWTVSRPVGPLGYGRLFAMLRRFMLPQILYRVSKST